MCIYPYVFLAVPGFRSHYIKILANSQIFLDTTYGSAWIVPSFFLDYIYLVISCLFPVFCMRMIRILDKIHPEFI